MEFDVHSRIWNLFKLNRFSLSSQYPECVCKSAKDAVCRCFTRSMRTKANLFYKVFEWIILFSFFSFLSRVSNLRLLKTWHISYLFLKNFIKSSYTFTYISAYNYLHEKSYIFRYQCRTTILRHTVTTRVFHSIIFYSWHRSLVYHFLWFNHFFALNNQQYIFNIKVPTRFKKNSLTYSIIWIIIKKKGQTTNL